MLAMHKNLVAHVVATELKLKGNVFQPQLIDGVQVVA